MSQENVELVRAAFRFFEEGNIAGVLSLVDEDIVVTQPADMPGVSPRQFGHADVREAFGIWPEQWDDFSVELRRIVDVGERVLVTTVQHGRGKESGIEVEMIFSFVFGFRAGKVLEWQIFMGEDEALKAVGLER